MAGGQQFELTGGRLCLDFANTVDNRPAPNRRDQLATYADLVAWSREAGILSGREATQLLARASRRPKEADKALAQARSVREVIYRIFSAIASGTSVNDADLMIMNNRLPALFAHSRVVRANKGFSWECSAAPNTLDRMLWTVARSALDLLLGEDVPHVRECAAGSCGWLFMDRSKNHRRRWCDMKVCGNRAKVRRFRSKRKKP